MTTVTEPLIGVLNAGSSSLKFSFYEGEKRLLTGQIDGIGVHPKTSAVGPDSKTIAPPELGGKPGGSPSELLPTIVPWARRQLVIGGSPHSATALSTVACVIRGQRA